MTEEHKIEWTRVELMDGEFSMGSVYHGKNQYGHFAFRYFEEQGPETQDPDEELFDIEGYIKEGCMHWGTDPDTDMHFCDEADALRMVWVMNQIWALERTLDTTPNLTA